MTNALAVPEQSAALSIMEVISRAARDPQINIDKMTRLLELQERIMAKQAEIEFTQAMNRLQPRLPVIYKNGVIAFESKGQQQRTPFARYEDIDAAIRPLLCEEGFSLSFDSQRLEGGSGEYSCKLSHVGGHSEVKRMILPADTSGSKNSIQAIGSTVSYAKRYLVGMHLNIITKNQDDDARAMSFIGEQQVQQVYDLFTACNMNDAASRRKFYEVAGVDSVEKIRADQYQGLVQMLMKKERQVRGTK